MHSLLERTARLFCFSRRQQRGLTLLVVLLWVTVIIRVWVYYHPAEHALPDAAVTAWQEFGREDLVKDGGGAAAGMNPEPVSESAADSAAAGSDAVNGNRTAAEETISDKGTKEVTDWQAVRQQRNKTVAKTREPVELNRADTTQLMALRGIGRTFSRRIVSYRNLLGGYTSTEQLKEVYGLRPGLVDTLSAQLTLDTLLIRRMALPGAAYRDLLRHPYLEKEDVDNIMAYMEINGGIGAVRELLDNKVLSRTTYLRIRPYLTIAEQE